MRTVSTNFVKTLVWKHEYDVKLWRHKQRTLNTNDHHVLLNENPTHENFLRTPLDTHISYRVQRKRALWLTRELTQATTFTRRVGRCNHRKGNEKGETNVGWTYVLCTVRADNLPGTTVQTPCAMSCEKVCLVWCWIQIQGQLMQL